MPRHTSREQDILIDQASSTVENIVTNLIAVIEQLDDRLEESINEADKLRTSVEILVHDLAESRAETEGLRITVGSLEHRIQELEAKQ